MSLSRQKYYNTWGGGDFQQVKELLLAPTEKVANNIKGNTIHSIVVLTVCNI